MSRAHIELKLAEALESSSRSTHEKSRVPVVEIPFVHSRIAISDLNKSNLKLFSDKQINAIQFVVNNITQLTKELGVPISKDIKEGYVPDEMRISKKDVKKNRYRTI